jgi:iron complex outermembrane receptor protein
MRRVKCIIAALAVLWLAPLQAQAQTGTITGRVSDIATQQPLVGVTITVGNRGALTESNGRFSLVVPAGTHTLRTSMLGYAEAAQSVTVVAGQTVVADVALTAQAIGLAELVVVGYGTQRAGNITGAVKQLSAAEFNTGRIVSTQELIQSKVAGVQVVDSNEPGGGISIRIRGATSVNASSNPLFVIDGVPVSGEPCVSGSCPSAGRNPLNFINPNDIESITVLKDAASAAIYGANAANGVVLITTKGGRGRPEIEYTGSVSGSTITRLPDMLNAAQFRTAVQQYAPQNVNQLGAENTDWFGLISRDAFGQEHNFAVSGAGSDMNYRLSLGYLNQDGVIAGTNTQRLGLGLNYNQRLFDNHLDVRGSIKGSRTEDAFTPGGVLSNAAQFGATQPIHDPASPTGFYEWPTSLSPENPLAVLALTTDKGTTYRSIGSLQAEYRLPFFEAFKTHVNLGYDVTKADRETFSPSIQRSEVKTSHGGSLYRSNRSLANTLLEVYGNYTAPLPEVPGNIDLVGGYSYSESNGDFPWVQASQLSTDLLGDNGLAGAGIVQNFADVQDSKLISFFGRLNYNLNDRYLLSASVRRDGSSRFGPNNAWGIFPAVSVAWRLSEEPFMKGLSGLSDLKLRGSWGKTGNQSFANYQHLSVYLVGDAQTQAQFGDEWVTTIRPSAADPNIKWEETNSYNLGMDYGIFGGRVTGAVDVYRKKTEDLIFTVPVAAGTNLSNYLTTNIGSMENKGVELSLSARMLNGGGNRLTWTADFNAAHNKNELLTINPFAGEAATQILTGSVAGGVGTTIQVLQKGQPINSFFVLKQNYDANGKPIEGSYEDLNGDGNINVDDRRAFRDPSPNWILGHSSYLTYNKFDLGFTLRAYLGNYVYNNVASNLGTYQEVTRLSPFNLHASVLETGFESPQYLSDYYVEDASFLRMDNLTLGYSLKYRGQPMRIFASVQSLFTMTGYSGVDPTAGLNGLDNNIYPRSRTFSGGLNVRF